jgi:hypothetical protein
MNVMHEAARKRVKEFIGLQVPGHLQHRVHATIALTFPEIHLQEFGLVVADGFRLPTPPKPHKIPGFQENINLLQSMGLANFDRAVQVLENFPDIDSAINFILAEKGMQ